MGFEVGGMVGDYEVLACLGAGGVGRVYKVRHSITGRVEAMKVLLPDSAEDNELCERFLREVRLQANLDHPNIASVLTAFRAEQGLVMIMELIEGEPLDLVIVRDRPPLHKILDYAMQALAALDYAHAHGVIHRDIKPENLLTGADGVLKVTDFGLAKTAQDVRLTQTGMPMGSLYYMSPEQVTCEEGADPRTDVYSMGAVLYQLATRRRPFKGTQAFQLMLAHVERQPTPPNELDPSLPQALNDAILKALAKNPDERFASAAEFKAALEQILQVLPETQVRLTRTAAQVERLGPQTAAWQAKLRSAAIAHARLLAVVLALVTTGAFAWMVRPAPAPHAEPSEQTAKSSPSLEPPLEPAPTAEKSSAEPAAPPPVKLEQPPAPSKPQAKTEALASAAKAAKPSPVVEEPPERTAEVSAPGPAAELQPSPPAATTPFPDRMRIRLTAPFGSDSPENSSVLAEVVQPAPMAGVRVEGRVFDNKSSGKIDGQSHLKVEFGAVRRDGRAVPIGSEVIDVRNSKGRAGLDDGGRELKSKSGVMKAGKRVAGKIGSAIGGIFGGGHDDNPSPAALTLTAKGPNISFLPGTEFDLNVAASPQ